MAVTEAISQTRPADLPPLSCGPDDHRRLLDRAVPVRPPGHGRSTEASPSVYPMSPNACKPRVRFGLILGTCFIESIHGSRSAQARAGKCGSQRCDHVATKRQAVTAAHQENNTSVVGLPRYQRSNPPENHSVWTKVTMEARRMAGVSQVCCQYT